MTLGLNPVPQILPALLIARKSVPVLISLALIQASIPDFTQFRGRNGSYVAALADKIGYDTVRLPPLYVFNAQRSQFRPA
jgi:hypothetical protein